MSDVDHEVETRLKVALATIESLNLTPEDLVALRDSGRTPTRITLREYLGDVRKAATATSRQTYDPYWTLLDVGAPDICGCACDRCVAEPTATKRNGRPGSERLVVRDGCPCRAPGTCRCSDMIAGSSCLDVYRGLGVVPLGDISLDDLTYAQRWAKARALRRDRARDLERARQGRPQAQHRGRHAEEHLVGAARSVFRLACGDPKLGLRVNPATGLTKPRRLRKPSRALTADQFAQLWESIFTTGSDDAELDMLLIWDTLEIGSRRAGKVGRTCDDLLLTAQAIRLREKGETKTDMPCSEALLRSLVGHALERGGPDLIVRCAAGLDRDTMSVDDVFAGRATLRPNAPVLYYRPRRRIAPDGSMTVEARPLTRRRLETLFARLRDHLPWADEAFLRPHDIRHTGGFFIERALGFAVAKAWLRQAGADVTFTYVGAVPAELAEANELLTGRPHPSARRRATS